MKEWNVNPVKKVFLSVLAALMALCVLFGIFALNGRADTALAVGAEDDTSEAPSATPQEQAVAAYKRYYELFMGTAYDEGTAGSFYKSFAEDLAKADAAQINGILKSAVDQFFGRWQSEAASVYEVAQAQRGIVDGLIDALGEGEYATALDNDLQKAIDEVELRIYKNEKLQELGEAYDSFSTARMPDFIDGMNDCNSQAGSDIEAAALGDKTLAEVQATIDGIVEQAKIDFRTCEVEGVAEQEYFDSYKAITGDTSGDTVPEAVLTVLHTIGEAVDAAVEGDYGTTSTRYALVVAWNENVAAALQTLLDGALLKVNGVLMDSQETYEIVSAAKQAVEEALNGAGVGETPDFSGAVSAVGSDLAAQRTAEKNAAKGEVNSAVAQLKGDKTYPQAIETHLNSVIAEAEEEIDSANYNALSLILDRFVGKAEFLDAFADFQTWMTAYGGNVDFNGAVVSALAAIGEANNADGVAWATKNALLNAEKSCASALLESLVSDGSDDVKGLLTGPNGYGTNLDSVRSAEEVKPIVDDAVVAIRGEKFFDENDVLRKAFASLGADDKTALEAAKTSLAALSDEKVKAYLDNATAYTSLEKEIEDRSAKADFEAKKSQVLGEIAKLININNVDVVLTALEEQRDAAEAENYVSHTGDATREKYLSDRKAALETILAKAQQLSASAAKLEEKLQQYEEQLQKYLESDNYTAAQKQEMQKKADEYAAQAADVLTEAVDENAAERALDDLFAQAAGELSQAPVNEITASGVVPENGDYAEGYDGDALWGTVTNESGIESGTVLTIGKKANASIDGIEEAAKNGKLKAAAGSGLTKSEMEDLLDNSVVLATLDVSLTKGDVKLDSFTGSYIVTILLPAELRDQALVVVCESGNGEVEVFDAHLSEDGKYLTFTTDHFSEFVILGEGPVTNMWWLVITLTVVVGLELVILLAVLLKKGGKKKGETAMSVLPLGLLALVAPADVTYICIVLGVAAVALGVGIFLAVRAKK